VWQTRPRMATIPMMLVQRMVEPALDRRSARPQPCGLHRDAVLHPQSPSAEAGAERLGVNRKRAHTFWAPVGCCTGRRHARAEFALSSASPFVIWERARRLTSMSRAGAVTVHCRYRDADRQGSIHCQTASSRQRLLARVVGLTRVVTVAPPDPA
jgi:hypothetical protein